MSELWTAAAAAALANAGLLASDAGHGYVGTEHLLCALLSVQSDSAAPCIAAKLLSARGITYEKTAKLLPAAQSHPGGGDAPSMTPSLVRICRRAQEEAARFRLAEDPVTQNAVSGTEHLLFSLLCESDTVAAHILAAQNVPLHELYGDVLSFLSAASAEAAIFSGGTSSGHQTDPSDDDSDVRFAGGREADGKSSAPDALPYLTDMTEAARRGQYDAVIGRDAETDAVLRILLRRGKNNPCLLGDAGVGKTAVVEGLAQRIAAGAVPSALKQARILSLSLGSLLAGTRYRGEFEERLRTVLQFCADAEQTGTPVILFLDEVHMLMGAGAAEGAADAANLLKPALSRGEIRVIGATTPSEYDKTVAQDAAMARRFQTVTVEEPSADAAEAMLRALVPKLEAHHGVVITGEAVSAAVRLSVRYLPEFCLPDKAIDTLDDACAAVAARIHSSAAPFPATPRENRDAALLSGDLSAAKAALTGTETVNRLQVQDLRPTVSADDTAQAIRARTGIALTAEDEEERRILQLETLLSAEIFGQDAAVRTVSTAIRRLRAGLSDPRRPAASFLFSGPSGVGKTALCTALARILFGGAAALLRYDMSEYMERHA
ncbi:MAG: ATP-dependent Clp protease ATP-binding subunit, partial [Clostridia bacterium]|nr:ATP-dependent Clp protease ATP-binding subunit [Clostridia bacterium]